MPAAVGESDAALMPIGLAGLLQTPIVRASLVGDVVERIRKSVVGGILKPGDPIIESQLADRLGISRGTIREAVRVLVGEGLLVKSHNATARVAELTQEREWEVYSMRLVLEGFAARLLAQRLQPEHLERLNTIWQHLLDAANANDKASFSDWDFALHETIVQMAGNETLYQTWRRLSAWISLTFAVQAYTPEVFRENAMDHRRIIDAIASGDAAQAERVMKQDLQTNIELGNYHGYPGIW